MKVFSAAALSICAIVGIVAACVVENSTPPYVPPQPTRSAADARAQEPSEGGSPLDATPDPADARLESGMAPDRSASDASPSAASIPPPPAYLACAADADCMAVPRNGCCNNGYKEAVSATGAEAYKASFVCPEPRPICPMFRIKDDRTPVCNSGTRTCELVAHR